MWKHVEYYRCFVLRSGSDNGSFSGTMNNFEISAINISKTICGGSGAVGGF